MAYLNFVLVGLFAEDGWPLVDGLLAPAGESATPWLPGAAVGGVGGAAMLWWLPAGLPPGPPPPPPPPGGLLSPSLSL